MNKLQVIVYVPLLDKKFDVFIPVNRKIGTIKMKLIEMINELTDNSLENIQKLRLYNKEKSREYNNNIYVKESNMENGTKLMLL